MTADASTRSQLLRAVLEEPFEDTVRLVYADELEECGQTGRAAYIRWHLGQRTPGGIPFDIGPSLEWHDPIPKHTRRERVDRVEYLNGDGLVMSLIYARGFVDEVCLPAAAFLEHAAALFRQHPITRVVLTGVTPWHQYFNGAKPTLATYAVGGRFDDSQSVIPEVLDPFVCELVTDIHTHRVVSGVWWTFKNDAHTLDILSRACVNYGRSLVGLRPLYART